MAFENVYKHTVEEVNKIQLLIDQDGLTDRLKQHNYET